MGINKKKRIRRSVLVDLSDLVKFMLEMCVELRVHIAFFAFSTRSLILTDEVELNHIIHLSVVRPLRIMLS